MLWNIWEIESSYTDRGVYVITLILENQLKISSQSCDTHIFTSGLKGDFKITKLLYFILYMFKYIVYIYIRNSKEKMEIG